MKAYGTVLAAIVAVATLGLPAFSQEGEVFAPYPSRLRVGVRGGDVVIAWEDSPDVKAGYAVYRHRAFPSAENFNEATLLGLVEPGVGSFTYKAPDTAPYFYFVLGRLPAGEETEAAAEYRLFIPLRNVAIDAVAVSEERVATQATGERPRIAGIIARADGDAIVVSVDASGDTGRLVVYRGTAPILAPSSLLDAALAAIVPLGSGPYRDYPVPGVEYYYAVISEKALSSGSISLEAGVNATVSPVSLQAGVFRVGLPTSGAASRSMPLPYLVLSRGFSDAKPVDFVDPLPRPGLLAPETEKSIATLLASHGSQAKAERPKITIFPEDLRSGGGGEEYALRSIVSAYLAKGAYAEAARQLTLFLSLPRSAANASKARFYRGQAQAMSGAYREAFFDLLQSQSSYYIESSAWIDYILEVISRG